MITKLLPNERLDDLQIKGYEIIQSPGRFCFGMDAVLLSAFARVKKNEKALDLGTGIKSDERLRNAVYLFGGKLIYKALSIRLGLPYYDMALFMSMF